jgi:hypothetical protein
MIPFLFLATGCGQNHARIYVRDELKQVPEDILNFE